MDEAPNFHKMLKPELKLNTCEAMVQKLLARKLLLFRCSMMASLVLFSLFFKILIYAEISHAHVMKKKIIFTVMYPEVALTSDGNIATTKCTCQHFCAHFYHFENEIF